MCIRDRVVSAIYRYSKGKIPIIGVGGIFNAQDAFDKIAACLLYTSDAADEDLV